MDENIEQTQQEEVIQTQEKPAPQKNKNAKHSLAVGITSIIAIVLMLFAIVYTFAIFLPMLSNQENGVEVLGFVLLFPYIAIFFGFTGLVSICLLVLAIINLKDRQNGIVRTKGFAIFSIILDFLVAGGYAFMTYLTNNINFVYLIVALFMLAYAIYKIVAISVCKATKEN